MKYPTIAILGVLILAAAAVLWILKVMAAVVAVLFVAGLIAACIGVILFSRERMKRIGRGRG